MYGGSVCLCDTNNQPPLTSRPEIREFPKGISDDNLDTNVLQGLRNCINLLACTWTRDGSLNSDVLKALQALDTLRELEINGRSEDNFNPKLLTGFTRVSRIGLIMPSAPVASPIVTDALLESLAPHVVNLQHLYLTGCPKVTHKGVWSLLMGSKAGILGLGLEALSSHFDMSEFRQRCQTARTLSQLTSITLTVHPQLPLEEWMHDVSVLLSHAPLQNFHIYSTGAFYESPSTEEFWAGLVATHGKRLVRFSVHRMLISLRAIEEICRRCSVLQQLFIVIEHDSLPNLSACLAQASLLRSIHINYPMEAHTEVVPVISATEALSIIQQCSSTLTQFGCNARVWQVARVIDIDAEGRLHARPVLAPYETPDIPEPFLVVRT
ncbi:hypothetical protein DXG03_000710 [Asterophora parasitica]|uniref:Uncharacterized protein n=1 Tax=Asterophora parasitica TaxID=117018 RepID=A0A9P7G7E9_9AGAR|nr:hypothetical protein DXG03_000710 [Asterophora parasitica]